MIEYQKKLSTPTAFTMRANKLLQSVNGLKNAGAPASSKVYEELLHTNTTEELERRTVTPTQARDLASRL